MSSFDITNKASEGGFVGFFMFPSSIQYPVLQALAIGILCHNAMVYPSISRYLDTNWKPQVQKVLDVVISNPNYADGMDENFWNDVSQAMIFLTTKIMLQDGKSHIYKKLHTSEPLTQHETFQMITILSPAIGLRTLHLHKSEGDYLIKTFNVPNSEALCVVIGEENGNWFYFIHRDFVKGNERRGFPFFCNERDEIEIPGFTGNNVRSEPQIEPDQFLTATLQLLLDVGQAGIPPALQDRLLAYQEQARLFQSTHPELPIETRNLLPAVQALQVRLPSVLKEGKHDIAQCAEFNVQEQYTTLNCGCTAHTNCLQQHLRKCMNSPGSIKVTCPKCHYELSEQELKNIDSQLFIELTKRNFSMKECPSCNHMHKQETMLNHCSKILICVDCLSNGVCPMCHRNLDVQQKNWITSVKSRLGGQSV